MKKAAPITLFLHLVFWIVYVLAEYLANLPHLSGREHGVMLRSLVLTLPFLMLPTYAVVFLAIPKLLQNEKYWGFGLSLLLVLVFVFYGRIYWMELITYLDHGHRIKIPYTKILKNVIRDYAVIALAICIYLIADWKRKSLQNKRLMERQRGLDLELLKRQLQPHFLFNTLNNIYSLSLKRSDQTSDSILRLSELLEYLVYQSGEPQVLLVDELALVKNYIALEELRYGKDLKVDIDTSQTKEGLMIPPLILLPFVENCFKHGGRNSDGVFWIKIRVSSYKNILKVSIENSKGKRLYTRKGDHGGVGIKNITDRLQLLYGKGFSLEISDNADFYAILLELNSRV
jgi:sensor histidine kinase YesM